MTGIGVNFREDTEIQGYGTNFLCRICGKDGLVICRYCNKMLCEGCAISH